MKYPGRIIKPGERDADVVRAIKRRLNQMLAYDDSSRERLDVDEPHYGPRTKQAIKLFQARHVDAEGRPLKQDGQVGPITWEVLFGESTVKVNDRGASDLLRKVIEIASAAEASGIREVPRNSNRGPEVDAYMKRAGAPVGYAWCCAFVYWCFDEAAASLGMQNPMVRTAGCLAHWNKAASKGANLVKKSVAVADPSVVKPGMVFIVDHGRGLGHTGIVERVHGGFLTTIEGNTDASKTREGGGVYRLSRKVLEINKGFIDYSRC